MSAKLASATFELGARPAPQTRSATGESQNPFHVVVIGDFTGRRNRGIHEPVATCKLTPVDCDNFGPVLARFGVKLRFPGASPGAAVEELAFAALEDFHPDHLMARSASLAKLFEARRLLLDPSTAQQGRAALQACLGKALDATTAAAAAESTRAESDQETLGRLLGGSAPARPQAAPSPVQQFIRQAVAPHVAPQPESWQQGALNAVDFELAGQLRARLHHPDFQSLEAAWRGLDFLVRHIEAVERVKVFVLDLSGAELQEELLRPTPIPQSHLFRSLRDHAASLLIGNLTFGQSADDLRALSRMADLSAGLRAPFIAGASPTLANCDAFNQHPDPDDWKIPLPPKLEQAWRALRQQPSAGHVGLITPRFLLRQPYRPSDAPIESFPFEELPGAASHESFLWGHPATLCACVLADAFQEDEVAFEPPAGGEVGDMPVHKFTSEGETVIKPYAEAWLTERAAARLAAGGIMSVLSRKDYNRVCLPGFYSIAASRDPLPFRIT